MIKRSFSLTAETALRLREVAEANGFKESAAVEVALRRLLDLDDVVEVLHRENASIRRISRSGWMRLFRELVNVELDRRGVRTSDVWPKISYTLSLRPNGGYDGGDHGQVLEIWVVSLVGRSYRFEFGITDSVYESARTVANAILAPTD